MADIKGSALPAATSPVGFDAIGVQGGTSKKIDRDVLVGGAGIVSTVGSGYPFSISKAATGAGSDFNISVLPFAGVNLPGSARQNTVANIGWNVGANGARQDPAEAMLRLGFEEHYSQAGTGKPAFEFHLSCMDTAGVEHRPISSYLIKDGSPESDLSFSAGVIGMNDYNYVQKLKFDFMANNIDLFDPALSIRSYANNFPTFRQLNAAGNGYLSLPYYDADNRIKLEAPVAMVGPTPTTGTYPNVFYAIQATSLAADGTLLQCYGPNVTGSAHAANFAGPCTGNWSLDIWNQSNTPSANAVLALRTIGTGAGDPYIDFTVNGGSTWMVGIDNSDDDKFKWGTWTLGSQDKMTLDTSGNLSLVNAGGGLRVKEGTNCKQGVATLVAGQVVVSNTSVTANSRIFLTGQSDGGTPGFLRVSARTAGTSFTITSSSASDTSVVAYEIFEPV